MLFFKVLILISLVRLVDTMTPKSCALIYAIFGFVITLMFGGEFSSVVISSIAAYFLAWLYFSLLHKLSGSFFWWIVLIVGLVIGLF